jgi:cobaltochelatase CobN
MLLHRCLVFVLCLTLWAAARADGVLLLTTSPSPPGRFIALEQAARAHALPLRARFVEKIAADELSSALLQGAELVLIDAPRQHIEDFVRGRLAPALPALAAAAARLAAGSRAQARRRLDAALARRLHGYFVQGGARNTEWLLQTLLAWRAGQDWRSAAAAAGLPQRRHLPPGAAAAGGRPPRRPNTWPRAASTPRSARRRWPSPSTKAASPPGRPAHRRPGAPHRSRRRAGLPFYSPVMDADGMRRMLTLDGQPVADVHDQHPDHAQPRGPAQGARSAGPAGDPGDGVAPRRPSRTGGRPQGIPLMDVPFYLAQAEYAGIADIQIAMATVRPGDEQLVPIDAQAAAMAAKALALAAAEAASPRPTSASRSSSGTTRPARRTCRPAS